MRKVYEETVATQYESRAQWQVLWATNEFIWYSERDNWGQLYLYDLTSGTLKTKITTRRRSGDVDRPSRHGSVAWCGTPRRDASRARIRTSATIYRSKLDGTGATCRSRRTTAITPAVLSPNARYVIDT